MNERLIVDLLKSELLWLIVKCLNLMFPAFYLS